MADLIFIACRDLDVERAGAVFPAQILRARDVDANYVWMKDKDDKALWSKLTDAAVEIVPEDQHRQIFDGRDVCFLIHGFNVSRDRGFTGPGAMAQELMRLGLVAAPDGAGAAAAAAPGAMPRRTIPPGALIVPVLWPGDWYIDGINYPFEYGDARETGRRLAEFLLATTTGLRSASFITHSFGVRVTLETILAALGSPEYARAPLPFPAAVFMAAADDHDILDRERYAPVFKALDHVTVVSSEADDVLGRVFRVGDIVEAMLWPHQRTFGPALGYSGPVFTPASKTRAKSAWRPIVDMEVRHSGYLPRPWEAEPDAPGPARNGWTAERERVLGMLREFCSGQTVSWPADTEPRIAEPREPSAPGRRSRRPGPRF